jgi:hypothetical protein
MRQINSYTIFIRGIIKDSFVFSLLFTILSFIDLRLAFFVSIVCISLFLTRRTILYLNPGFIDGHRIYFKETALKVPDGVEFGHSLSWIFPFLF